MHCTNPLNDSAQTQWVLNDMEEKENGIHSEQKEKVDSSVPLKHLRITHYIKIKGSLPK